MIGKNTVSEDKYVGNNTAGDFAITFPTWDPTDLVVFVNRLADGVNIALNYEDDFSLNNAVSVLTLVEDGQEWTNGTGKLAVGYTIFIQFTSDAYQPSKFTDLGRTAPMKFEGSLDRLAMILKSVDLKASRALSTGPGSVNGELPPTTGNENKILKVNAAGDGFDYGPDVQDIFDARDEAQTAATAANASAIAAQAAEDAAGDSAVAAAGSAVAASNFADEAEGYKDSAAQSEANALSYANEAELWAKFFAFQDIRVVTFADSPYTVTYVDDDNFLISVDTTGGNVAITLPDLSGMPSAAWKVGFVKTTADANMVTFTPQVGQTINGQANLVLSQENRGVVFNDNTPTNWEASYIIVGSFGSASSGGLPAGGAAGDFIQKNSTTEGDASWISGTLAGFSTTLNKLVTTTSLLDAINQLFGFQYLAPQVTISATNSNVIREKGVALTATTLTANVTRRSDAIARIQFFLGVTQLVDYNPPSQQGTGATNYSWTGSIQDTSTFSTTVTDDGTSGGPTDVSSSVTYNFVYPYFSGTGLPGRTAAQVAAMSKLVALSNATVARNFTTSAGDVYYFAYPTSYGALTSILDANNFETIGDWTLRLENITGADGASVPYRIYEFNNPVIAGTTSYTFKR